MYLIAFKYKSNYLKAKKSRKNISFFLFEIKLQIILH
jgi:hypothetical protein